MPRGLSRWLVVGVLFSLLLVAISPRLAESGFSHALRQQLESRLPALLSYTPEKWDESDPSRRILASRMNRDFAALAAQPEPGPLAQCRARLVRVQGEQLAAARPDESLLSLHWRRDDTRVIFTLGTACDYNWLYIASTQVPLALLVTWLLSILPPPLTGRRRDYFERLLARGCSRREALHLTRGLDGMAPPAIAALDILLEQGVGDASGLAPAEVFAWAGDGALAGLAEDQLAWFRRALVLYPGDVQRAAGIARSAPELVLYPREARVTVHGVPVNLPATPFFYYCWYAQRRQRDPDPNQGGWFTNPPANRADHEHASELVRLMLAHQGHGKAIADLRDKGLRAKTLDQNRSKVKEQLAALLGAELAAPYLFEMERDSRTARFRCRLATAPGKIRIRACPDSAGEIVMSRESVG